MTNLGHVTLLKNIVWLFNAAKFVRGFLTKNFELKSDNSDGNVSCPYFSSYTLRRCYFQFI